MDLREFRLIPGTVTPGLFPDQFERLFIEQRGSWNSEEDAHLNYAIGHFHFLKRAFKKAGEAFAVALKNARVADLPALVVDCMRMIIVVDFEVFTFDRFEHDVELVKKHGLHDLITKDLTDLIDSASECGDPCSRVCAINTAQGIMVHDLFSKLSSGDDSHVENLTSMIATLGADLVVAFAHPGTNILQQDPGFMSEMASRQRMVDLALRLNGDGVIAIIEEMTQHYLHDVGVGTDSSAR